MWKASKKFVPWKERKEVATDLKAIYRAETVEALQERLADFMENAPEGLEDSAKPICYTL